MASDVTPTEVERRTLLANERTYLAWWRTGLTALAAGLGTARVVPQLSSVGREWPYTVIGVALCAIGTFTIGYGQRRRIAVDDAVRSGDFAGFEAPAGFLMTGVGVLVGVGLIVAILFG